MISGRRIHYTSATEDEFMLEHISDSDSGIDANFRNLYRKAKESRLSDKEGTEIKKRVVIGDLPDQAGRRKIQRWKNDNFVDSDYEVEPEGIKELFTINHKSIFSQIFSSRENLKTWCKFLEMSEEDQRRFLDALNQATKKNKEQKDLNGEVVRETRPSILYGKIERKLRATVKRCADSSVLMDIENHIAKFIEYVQEEETKEAAKSKKKKKKKTKKEKNIDIEEGDVDMDTSVVPQIPEEDETNTNKHHLANGYLIFVFKEKYQRLLAHAACMYYQLKSYSMDTEKGDRITFVKKCSKVGYALPKLTLAAYVKQMAPDTNIQ